VNASHVDPIPPVPNRYQTNLERLNSSFDSLHSLDSNSTVTWRGNESSSSTLHLDRERGREKKLPLPPLDTRPRRHLASSRSTAEMKGKGKPPTTPSSHLPAGTSKGPSFESDSVSFVTSTPRPGAEVQYPFVCPERLVQYQTSPKRDQNQVHNKDNLTPTFRRPRPAPRPTGSPFEVSDHTPIVDTSQLARVMTYESTYPATTTSPVDSETLERLFDEVLQACRTGDIPYTSPTGSGHSVYSTQPETPFKSPGESSESNYSAEAITPKVRHGNNEIWSPSFEFDSPGVIPQSRKPSSALHTNARELNQESDKRFIPSGRSFEPLRADRMPNTAMLTGSSLRDDKWPSSVGSNKGRVRQAVAKFENAASGSPATPMRGELLSTLVHRADEEQLARSLIDLLSPTRVG